VLFAVSIGAFGTSNIIDLKILGIGTALAVLVDAVLVRCLLLPATLTLLDRRAWWLPGSTRPGSQRRIDMHDVDQGERSPPFVEPGAAESVHAP
jgi:uncharacterized membrane protein YdfJ with MMPL/SSD domain